MPRIRRGYLILIGVFALCVMSLSLVLLFRTPIQHTSASSAVPEECRSPTTTTTLRVHASGKNAVAVLSRGVCAHHSDVTFTREDDPQRSDVIWTRSVDATLRREIELTRPHHDGCAHRRPLRAVNFLPGRTAKTLTDKAELAAHMHEDVDIMPYTIVLATYEQKASAHLLAATTPLPHQRVWVLKQSDLSQGFGVRVVQGTLSEFFASEDYKRNVLSVPYKFVLQRYIESPMLLDVDRRKSEIRMYWVVMMARPESCDEFVSFLHTEGTVRLNSRPYSLHDTSDRLVHITNERQQKLHDSPDAHRENVESGRLKWTFARWSRDPSLPSPEWVNNTFLPDVRRKLQRVLSRTHATLRARCRSGYSPPENDGRQSWLRSYVFPSTANPPRLLFFELFGVDVIVERGASGELVPRVSEVQGGPGLSHAGHGVKSRLIPTVLCDTLQLVWSWSQSSQNNNKKQQLLDRNTVHDRYVRVS